MTPPNRVFPTVTLAVPCLKAEYDTQTGEVVVRNPLAVIGLPPGQSFPFDAEEVWVYAQLTGGLGAFRLAIELRERLLDGSERVVGRSGMGDWTFTPGNRLFVIDAVFCLTAVPFDNPGLYEFWVLADDQELDGHVPVLRMLDTGVTL